MHGAHDLFEDVGVAVIEDGLGGIQAQAVEMELADPIAGIGEIEIAHRPAIVGVEIDGRAPIGDVLLGEVVVGELAQVIARRAKVVVDHIEDDGEAQAVGGLDEARACRRGAVLVRRGKQADAVIAPAEVAGEVGDGHDLDDGDAGVFEMREFFRGRRPGPFRSEGAEVELVDDLSFERLAAPCRFGGPPRKRRRDR